MGGFFSKRKVTVLSKVVECLFIFIMIDNVIFILGCGHSGTTLLRKIIGNHKNILEINYESYIFYTKEIIKFDEWNNDRKLYNKKWICEKTPKHIYKIDMIYEYINDPKIIIIIRNGLDVITSLLQRYGNVNIALNRYINDNYQWLLHKNKEKFHIIKYENLILNTEIELQKICHYLNEDYDYNMINYVKNPFELDTDFFKHIYNNESSLPVSSSSSLPESSKSLSLPETSSLPSSSSLSLICDEKHEILRSYQINQNLFNTSINRYENELSVGDMNICLNNESFIDIMTKLEYDLPSSPPSLAASSSP